MVFFIENSEKSVFDVDSEIKAFRNEHNKITPEFAKNILSKTNHRANIRFVLKQISLLDEEERKAFGEFAVCAVDGRAHDDSICKELRNLAVECECVEEFDSANERRKLYGPDDCMGTVVRHLAQLQDCIDKGGITVLDFENRVSDLSFKNADLSKIRINKLFLDPEYISTFYVSCTNYDKFDCGILTRVNGYFNECDLGGGEKFYIAARNIKLDKVTNMSKKCCLNNHSLGYSRVNCMCIVSNSDFAGCESIWVSGFDDFIFLNVSNVSGNVDFSRMVKANIGGCDFDNVDALRIDKVERCDIGSVKMPPIVHIGEVKEIYFNKVDFDNVESMTFDRVDKVDFKGGKLPRKLDVSKVKEVSFSDECISGVEEIVFNDMAQKNKALKGRKYSGKIKYSSLWGLGFGNKEM